MSEQMNSVNLGQPAPDQEANLNIAPDRRICGALTNMQRIAPRLIHYGHQIDDEQLSRELAKLERQIKKALRHAHRVSQAAQ